MSFLKTNNASGFCSGEAVDSFLQSAWFYSGLGYPFTKCQSIDSDDFWVLITMLCTLLCVINRDLVTSNGQWMLSFHILRFYFSVMKHSPNNKCLCLFRTATNYLEGTGFNSWLEHEPHIMRFFVIFNQCIQESSNIAIFLKLGLFFVLPCISKRYLLIILYYDAFNS